MSLNCQKNYTIEIAPTAQQVYWEFESGPPFVDSIQGLSIIQTFSSGGGAIALVAGKIGNAAEVNFTSSDAIYGMDCPDNPVTVSVMPYKGGGFTWTFWMKYTIDPTASNDFAYTEYGWTALGGTPGWGFQVFNSKNTGALDMTAFTPAGNVGIALAPMTDGVWYFFAVVYDEGTNTVTWMINNAVVGTSLLPSVPSHEDYGFVTFGVGNIGSGTNLTDFDEMGLWIGRTLSTTELDFIWNGGAGQRPPFTG